MSESHIPQVTSTSTVHSLGYAYENDDQTNNMDARIQITSLELLLHESSTAFTINYYQTEQLRDNAML